MRLKDSSQILFFVGFLKQTNGLRPNARIQKGLNKIIKELPLLIQEQNFSDTPQEFQPGTSYLLPKYTEPTT